MLTNLYERYLHNNSKKLKVPVTTSLVICSNTVFNIQERQTFPYTQNECLFIHSIRFPIQQWKFDDIVHAKIEFELVNAGYKCVVFKSRTRDEYT